MRIICLIALLFGSASAFADTVCSNSNQSFFYDKEYVKRGMPPASGDPVYTETVSWNGVDYGPNEWIEGLSFRPKFTVNFDTNKQKTIENLDTAGYVSTYYTYVDSISVGSPGMGHVVAVYDWVICTQTVIAVP